MGIIFLYCDFPGISLKREALVDRDAFSSLLRVEVNVYM
jgi:hypothetical protein